MGRATTTRRIAVPEGVEIRDGTRKSSLRITFIWQGKRRRETLDIEPTPANIKYAARRRAEVINAIERGTFDYAEFFPKSKHAMQQAAKERAKPTVQKLIEAHIDEARKTGSLAPATVVSYGRRARARIYPKFGDMIVDELTTPELRAWIVDMVSELSPKQVRNVVGVLSTVFNRALTDGVIERNPLAPITLNSILPKRRKASEEDKIDPFNDDEVAAILKACDSIEERCAYQFGFSTGARIGEIMALKWQNIDWANSLVHIEETVAESEKGTVEKTTKTDCERDVPILPATKEALLAMRPISELKGEYVFINRQGQRWRDVKQFRDRWRINLRKAGIRYRNPYQMRHTFGSRLLMNGEPELLVSKLFGHTTVEMVRRHYARYIKQPDGIQLRGDYSKFGADLGQQNPVISPLSPVKKAG